jgi:hypothetical protein
MPITAYVGERTIRAGEYRAERDNPLTCPECNDPMHYRPRTSEPRRIAHFAHNPRPADQPRTCALALMTVEHLNAIETLLKSAPGVFGVRCGKAEHRVADGKRRADVFFPGDGARYPVVFEAQFSAIKFAWSATDPYTIEGRTDDYHEAGVHVVWCLPAKRRNLIASIKRAYGCYGLLSDDGTEVEFVNTKALFLNQDPVTWLAERTAWLDAQEAKRAEEQYQAEAARRAQIEHNLREYEAQQREIREREIQRLIAERQQDSERFRIEDAASVAAWERLKHADAFRDALNALHRTYDTPTPTAAIAEPVSPLEAAAHKAWKSGGSMGLGLWLAKTIREREGRSYTVADYERWCERMRQIEAARPRITCACCGRYDRQHDTRLVLCDNCGSNLAAARAFVVTMVLKTEAYLQQRQECALSAIARLDETRRGWWVTFEEAQATDRPRADAAIAKAYQGDPDPFFATLRTWLIYQEVANVYTARQRWAAQMEEVLQ